MSPRSVAALVFVHAVLAIAILVSLFLTVHNRRTDTECFNSSWVRTGILHDRWSVLIEAWRREGYLAHGGLWRLDDDPWFRGWIASGDTPWFEEGRNYDPSRPHYYRSNSALFVLPLAASESMLRPIVAEQSRLPAVLHGQLVVAAAAIVVGLLGHRLARMAGADRTSSVVLGLATQMVFQTNVLHLAVYWRLYPQHVFAAPLAAFLLGIGLRNDRPRTSEWLHAIGAAGMLAVDPPHAVLTLVAWVITSLVLDRPEMKPRLLLKTLIPALGVAAVILLQFATVAFRHPNAEFLGSSLLFRSGLDGDTGHHQGLLDGFGKLLIGRVLEHAGVAGTGIAWWSVVFASIPLTLIIAAKTPRLRIASGLLATGGGGFFLFCVLLSNAFAIHPFVYPTLLLVPALPCIFGLWVGALEGATGRPRTIALLTLAFALFLSMSQLREFAVAYPISADERLISDGRGEADAPRVPADSGEGLDGRRHHGVATAAATLPAP
jgi:hypothetical protein